MTESFFPDNTVLCNFAAVTGWTSSSRCSADAAGGRRPSPMRRAGPPHSCPPFARLAAEGWLDEPIEITAMRTSGRSTRSGGRSSAAPTTSPLKHLGEAQTCYVIKNWAEFAGSWWISDDGEALRYAKFQGITTRETIDIVSHRRHRRRHRRARRVRPDAADGRLRPPPQAPQVPRGVPALNPACCARHAASPQTRHVLTA